MNATPPARQPPPYPRRFGWPMRLFLTLFLAAITYRCFAIFFPIERWTDQFEVRRYPQRLSTLAELGEKAGEASDENPHPVLDDLLGTADSVWDYWKPWPRAETRPKIKTWGDGAKATACWVHWRLGFVEHLCAIDEGWPMFSPSLATAKYHTRARLFYADDSEVVLRQTTEPDDYRRYSHWFHDKRGNYERAADDDWEDACYGYCHFLLHRYGRNDAGSKLVKVVLFQVRVELPWPDADPEAHYAEQNRLTASPPRLPGQYRSDPARPAALVIGAGAGVTGGRAARANAKLWAPQVLPDFYEFDAAARKGHLLKDEK
jgi:hypothetical protein